MAVDWEDLEPRKTAPGPALGSDLSRFSVEDLESYAAVLHAEIERVNAKINEKRHTLDAAQSVFKK
jgi:uncharacterized small protein (DUF1192 family)